MIQLEDLSKLIRDKDNEIEMLKETIEDRENDNR